MLTLDDDTNYYSGVFLVNLFLLETETLEIHFQGYLNVPVLSNLKKPSGTAPAVVS